MRSAPRLAGLVELRVQAESRLNHLLQNSRDRISPISTVKEDVPTTSFLDLPRLASLTRTIAGIVLQAISHSHCIWENDSYSSMILWFLKGVTLREHLQPFTINSSQRHTKTHIKRIILDLLHISKPSRHLPPHYVVN